MFEKEAEEYTENPKSAWKQGMTCVGSVRQAFKDGAEFGYKKANEWHYVSKKDYPKDFKDIWICFITEEDMKDYVRGWYEYDIELDEHYFKTSNDFGIASIKNVYAWMPLVPPKEIKENERRRNQTDSRKLC